MTTPQEPWRRWLLAVQRRSETLVLPSRIEPNDIPELCRKVQLLASATAPGAVLCDVGALTDPDAVAIDALARLQLTARRLGTRITLTRTPEKLSDLLDFAGLSSIVTSEASALEPVRKTE